MKRLPVPTGPFGVGAIHRLLTDNDRPIHALGEEAGRPLFAKLWYPADASDAPSERLWADLRSRSDLPLSLRWLLWRFRNVTTTTVEGATCRHAGGARPLTIYCHGMVSFAGEATTLAEALASHGYPVMAVDHLRQFEEFQALRRADDSNGGGPMNSARALRRATPAERAELGRQGFAHAPTSGRIVAERAADIGFVLSRFDELAIPGGPTEGLATDELLLAGLSLGGAVANRFAADDRRVRAVANMDGGLFGQTERLRPIPYLMLSTDLTEGLNDLLIPEGAERITCDGVKHLNFHDMSALMPELRWLGATGKRAAGRFVAERNELIRDFFDRHAGA